MSTYDHEGRPQPDPSVVTRDSEGRSNIKELLALLIEKLTDEDFSEFMKRFGANLVAMVGTAGKKFGQDAKLRELIREAQQGRLADFKASIGDDRKMRVLNGPRTA
jgi:hypothetical protein